MAGEGEASERRRGQRRSEGENRRRTASGVGVAGRRESKTRTEKPYVPNVKFVHGRKLVRPRGQQRGAGQSRAEQGLHGGELKRVRTLRHTYTGHYGQRVGRRSSRARPTPTTAIEIFRNCAANSESRRSVLHTSENSKVRSVYRANLLPACVQSPTIRPTSIFRTANRQIRVECYLFDY